MLIASTTFLKEYFITMLMENAFPDSKTQNTSDAYIAPPIHIHQLPAARLIVFITKGNNENSTEAEHSKNHYSSAP